MPRIQPLTEHEFNKIRDLLRSVCGIDLKPDQDYLVETRLTELALEIKAETFGDLHRAIIADPELLPKVVDLMTTNETLWFRDDSCWATLEKAIIPRLMEKISKGQKVRIWSAASSTGQEAYSLIMLLTETLERANKLNYFSSIEIVGTDISQAALFLAKNGRYDPFTISRGLSIERKERFFTEDGMAFTIAPEIRGQVKFQTYNLMDSFAPLGKFDLVFCRNVAIYFSKDFKEELFAKIAQTLTPTGVMILGATESLFGLKTDFDAHTLGTGIYYGLAGGSHE